MGHKDDNTFQAYISRTSGVDVQAIISGSAADQDLIDFVASMQTSVDLGAPVQHGSLLAHARKRNTLSPDTAVSSGLETGDPYNPFEGTETANPFTCTLVRKPPSRHLIAYLKHDAVRSDFVKKLTASDNGHQTLQELVAPLRAMAAPETKDWSYPGAQPSAAGACRYCGQDVSRR